MTTPEIFTLIVDDEVDFLQFLEVQLNRLKIGVLKANTVASAWEIIQEQGERIAFVISDYRIGDQTGVDLRELMMNDHVHIPFVILSGFIDRPLLEKGMTFKIEQYIEKPINDDDLTRLVNDKILPKCESLQEKIILKSTYVEEAQDQMLELEPLILELEAHPNDSEILNGIFRLVHTMKGGSGVLDLPIFTKYLHHYEDLFSQVKSQKIVANKEFVTVVLSAFDELGRVMSLVISGRKPVIDMDHWQGLFRATVEKCQLRASQNPQKITKQNAGVATDHEATIKITTTTLDRFMELSGEMTVIRNTVNRLVTSLEKDLPGNKNIRLLREFLEEMHKVTFAIQTKITDLRKVPLTTVYRSLPRIIRDLNASLKKDINLTFDGEQLKVDTKLAQTIGNVMTHIIRNCADHGLEDDVGRQKAGKPAQGTISVSSYQDKDIVKVEIADDGKGINTEIVKAKALEKNLVTAERLEKMSDEKICQLIMEPGFSTAETITDISGRGVGMDMVKTSVENTGGNVRIRSTPGAGSQFTLTLPIPKSVVIISSLSVEVSGHHFNIPQSNIVRILRIEKKDRSTYVKNLENTEILLLENQFITITSLANLLNLPSTKSENDVLNLVVIKGQGSDSVALKIDEINDTEEIVIKSILSFLNKDHLFQGATFMGDGSISLILSPEGIVSRFSQQELGDFGGEQKRESMKNQDQGYILFNLVETGIFAIPLEKINRLEVFSSDRLKLTGFKTSFIHNGHIVEIVIPGEHQDMNSYISPDKSITVAILQISERLLAIAIKEVVDILYTDTQWDTELDLEPHIAGQMIVGERIVNVLDISQILGIPMDEKEETEESGDDRSANVVKEEIDQPMAAGFGLF